MPKPKKKRDNLSVENESEPLLEIEESSANFERELLNADQLQIDRIDEKKIRNKDIDDMKVTESVLDVETSKTLFGLRKRNIIDKLTGIISAGKEANVYHGYGPKNSELAIKIYRTSTNIFKTLQVYIIGDPRFNKIKRDQRSFVYAWAKKEFKNLSRAYQAKVSIPKPIECVKDIVVMEFIGKKGLPYPLLKDAKIRKPTKTYQEILKNLETLYFKAGLVHADLSEYNMIYTPKIYFIDISQAVLVDHPYAEIFLYRDIKNVTRFFEKLNVKIIDPDILYEKFVGEPPSDKVKVFEIN
ncbi:MAG: serine protein kinase RIO [Candidatus Heimdallarchaeota archaeon]|nr:serine protein kinase RIO [Candidatus Heimdallarchaeota archaeon]